MTTYFCKLINGEVITVNYHKKDIDPYAVVNMICSNVRQIARNPLALAADNGESVKRLMLLSTKLEELFNNILTF